MHKSMIFKKLSSERYSLYLVQGMATNVKQFLLNYFLRYSKEKPE